MRIRTWSAPLTDGHLSVNASKPALLRARLEDPAITCVAGVGDGLSAVLAERAGFDALWASGLAISAAHAVPDASILTMSEFLGAAMVADRASSLPVIADCDTGFGDVHNTVRMVEEYERGGIAGVCIEDKEFPKRNSFRDGHRLADVDEFSLRIEAACAARKDPDFLVMARVEALIAGTGLDDALRRAHAYREAGAGAILVHSRSTSPDEVLEFARIWRRHGCGCPLVAVPTTYGTVTATELEANGIRMVIYANQALRAAIHAMTVVLKGIRISGRACAGEEQMAPLEELFSLIGSGRFDQRERWFQEALERRQAGSAIRLPHVPD
jgi:phosphoenolpyruvate phosphomutase